MAISETLRLHKQSLTEAQKIFEEKQKLYGSTWEHMDIHYLADRMLVKWERIHTLASGVPGQVKESISSELLDIMNYALIALMLLKKSSGEKERLALPLYRECAHAITKLFTQKNNDYNDAWRKMRYASILVQIKVKLARILHENPAQTTESVVDQLQDIVNYAIFALHHPEKPHPKY